MELPGNWKIMAWNFTWHIMFRPQHLLWELTNGKKFRLEQINDSNIWPTCIQTLTNTLLWTDVYSVLTLTNARKLSATYDPNRTMFGSVPCVTRTDNLYWLPVTRAKSNGTGNEDEKVESRSMPVTLASVETQRPPRGFSFINIDIWFACTDINVILIKTESR